MELGGGFLRFSPDGAESYGYCILHGKTSKFLPIADAASGLQLIPTGRERLVAPFSKTSV